MANLADIKLSSIANGILTTTSATVGFDKTFGPDGWKPGNVAAWVDRSGGIPLGFPRYTFNLRSPTKDSRVYKVSSKLYYPIMETIDPAVGIFGPKQAYELQAHLDVLLPERATTTDRSVFLSLLRSLLSVQIQASDAAPIDSVGSPLVTAISTLEDVF